MIAKVAYDLEAIDVDLKHLADRAVVDLRGTFRRTLRRLVGGERERAKLAGDDGVAGARRAG
jgi:hypothetical protein